MSGERNKPPTYGLQYRSSTAELTGIRRNSSRLASTGGAVNACFVAKFPARYHKKSPAPMVRGARLKGGGGLPPPLAYIGVMSRSLVSGRKIRPTTKLIAATTIGYHRPE